MTYKALAHVVFCNHKPHSLRVVSTVSSQSPRGVTAGSLTVGMLSEAVKWQHQAVQQRSGSLRLSTWRPNRGVEIRSTRGERRPLCRQRCTCASSVCRCTLNLRTEDGSCCTSQLDDMSSQRGMAWHKLCSVTCMLLLTQLYLACSGTA